MGEAEQKRNRGVKVISMIEPAANGLECSESYYRNVHVPLIRRTLLPDPEWLTYAQDRILAQYDGLGGFRKKPDRWRLVHLRARVPVGLDVGRRELASRPNPQLLKRVIEMDHPNFVGGLRRFEAAETVVRSALSDQTALKKYIVFAEEDTELPDSPAPYDNLVDTLSGAATATARGVRRLVRNDILGETEIETRGQALVPTDRRLPTTNLLGLVELWFDSRWGAEEYFASDEVVEIIHYGGLRATAYEVEETCGFDKR